MLFIFREYDFKAKLRNKCDTIVFVSKLKISNSVSQASLIVCQGSAFAYPMSLAFSK